MRSEDEEGNVPQIFVEMLEEDIKKINEIPKKKKMIMRETVSRDFRDATKCWICNGSLLPTLRVKVHLRKKNEKKVRDHCHFTGKYRKAAHNNCNLNYKKPKLTPVVFHNLQNYDAHLFIKDLGKSEENINCIPKNEEKYNSFSKNIVVGKFTNKEGKEDEIKHDLRFIDSLKFMASSLDC